ncbi:hypothetical protein J6590_056696 [Homalodisca vitripennis]|nr:hypothetical protein J6590_056696 [Homalodisca vitripennis]
MNPGIVKAKRPSGISDPRIVEAKRQSWILNPGIVKAKRPYGISNPRIFDGKRPPGILNPGIVKAKRPSGISNLRIVDDKRPPGILNHVTAILTYVLATKSHLPKPNYILSLLKVNLTPLQDSKLSNGLVQISGNAANSIPIHPGLKPFSESDLDLPDYRTKTLLTLKLESNFSVCEDLLDLQSATNELLEFQPLLKEHFLNVPASLVYRRVCDWVLANSCRRLSEHLMARGLTFPLPAEVGQLRTCNVVYQLPVSCEHLAPQPLQVFILSFIPKKPSSLKTRNGNMPAWSLSCVTLRCDLLYNPVTFQPGPTHYPLPNEPVVTSSIQLEAVLLLCARLIHFHLANRSSGTPNLREVLFPVATSFTRVTSVMNGLTSDQWTLSVILPYLRF